MRWLNTNETPLFYALSSAFTLTISPVFVFTSLTATRAPLRVAQTHAIFAKSLLIRDVLYHGIHASLACLVSYLNLLLQSCLLFTFSKQAISAR